ncbi:hypothetical protein SHIRM173S_00761 [Streptomyces hirsutus]
MARPRPSGRNGDRRATRPACPRWRVTHTRRPGPPPLVCAGTRGGGGGGRPGVGDDDDARVQGRAARAGAACWSGAGCPPGPRRLLDTGEAPRTSADGRTAQPPGSWAPRRPPAPPSAPPRDGRRPRGRGGPGDGFQPRPPTRSWPRRRRRVSPLALVLADLLDRLVEAAYALQQHQRPGTVVSPGARSQRTMRICGNGRGTRPCSRRAARRVCFSARSNRRRRQGHAREEVRSTRAPCPGEHAPS